MTQEFDAKLVEQLEDAVSFAIYTAEDTKPVFIKQVVAKAALSVIAPHYEKQISDLKSQITQWNDDMDAAPKKNNVKIDILDRGKYRIPNCYWHKQSKCWYSLSSDKRGIRYKITNPTHWMHIPRPPELPIKPACPPKTAESEE